MATIILYVYVSHFFSCSYAVLTHTNTYSHPYPPPLGPLSPFCSLLYYSLPLILVLYLCLSSFVALFTIQVTKEQRSSLVTTLIRRQGNQWNSNYFRVSDVRKNIHNLIFLPFLHRETNSQWVPTMNSQDRYRTIWKESRKEVNEKTEVQKITCLEIISGRRLDSGLLTTYAQLLAPCSFPTLPPLPSLRLGRKYMRHLHRMLGGRQARQRAGKLSYSQRQPEQRLHTYPIIQYFWS